MDGPQDLEALKSDPAKRKKLMQSLLHTADLYNPIKPFDVTREWAIRLQTEFNQQCDLERQEGLPVLPFMDGRGETALAKGETGFISFVAKPWWEAIAAAFPVVKPHLDTITNSMEVFDSHGARHCQVALLNDAVLVLFVVLPCLWPSLLLLCAFFLHASYPVRLVVHPCLCLDC